jgi:hypothetical protein
MANRWKGQELKVSKQFVELLAAEKKDGVSWTQFKDRYGVSKSAFLGWLAASGAKKPVRVKSGLLLYILRRLAMPPADPKLRLPPETIQALEALDPLSEPDKFEGTRSGDYFVRSRVQILDLRTQEPRKASTDLTRRNRVVLLDHFEFRKQAGNPRDFSFPHATTGTELLGRCISHPHTFRWEEVEVVKGTRWKKRYRMTVPHEPLEDEKHCAVLAEITFVNAFDGLKSEWFEAGVSYPQASLTIVLLFSKEQRCLKVQASAGHPCGPDEVKSQVPEPYLSPEGTLVHWYVDSPKQGQTYRLDWEW